MLPQFHRDSSDISMPLTQVCMLGTSVEMLVTLDLLHLSRKVVEAFANGWQASTNSCHDTTQSSDSLNRR